MRRVLGGVWLTILVGCGGVTAEDENALGDAYAREIASQLVLSDDSALVS